MRLLIFGLGYCGRAAATLACAAGWEVVATSRSPGPGREPGLRVVPFDSAGPEVAAATHILATAPPRDGADPVLARYAPELRAAPALAWIGYLSTTGVYGDRGGGWVDETTEPAPTAERSRRRLAAELAWRALAASPLSRDVPGAPSGSAASAAWHGAAGTSSREDAGAPSCDPQPDAATRPLDIFRLAGIYGPGRSAFDDLRAGRARRIVQAGHAFGRIHVDDIAAGIMAAIAMPPEGARVLNFSDDEPAESADVTAEAARLLGLPVPPAIPFEEAFPAMSEMARSFWSENRRVASRATQEVLNRRWRYPTYREGLRAILEVETRKKAVLF